MPEGDASLSRSDPAPAKAARFGTGFLRDIWYFAALGTALKPGKLQRYEILGEPILLGRTGGPAPSTPCAMSVPIAPRRCRPGDWSATAGPRWWSAPTTAGGSAPTGPARRSHPWST